MVDGVLYAGSTDGYVYTLDPKSGGLLQRFPVPSKTAQQISIVDGVVYIGSADGNVYALDLATGELRWSYLVGDHVSPYPAAREDVIYVSLSDGHVCALNVATGKLIWRFQTGDSDLSDPTVDGDGTVYVGTGSGHVYALDAVTGELRWRSSFDGQITSSTVGEAAVYVTATRIDRSIETRVYALSRATGELIWYSPSGHPPYNAPHFPVIGKVILFVPSLRGIFAFDAATGRFHWHYPTGYRLSLAGNVVYSSGALGSVFALNAATGERTWLFSTNAEEPLSSSGGKIVAGLQSEFRKTESLSIPTVAGGLVYIGSSYKNVYALDAKTGVLQWQFRATSVNVRSPPFVEDGVVYIFSGGLSALDALTGELCWTLNPEFTVWRFHKVDGRDTFVMETMTRPHRWNKSRVILFAVKTPGACR